MVCKSPFQNQNRTNSRKITARFHAVNRKCFWCGKETVIAPRPTPDGYRQPDNMATIDHLYSKNDIRRAVTTFEKASVLSCYQCNYSRHLAEQKSIDMTEYAEGLRSFNLIQFMLNKEQEVKECDARKVDSSNPVG